MTEGENLSARDLIQLSAYLDGELEPAESEALEARLDKEAELRQRLEQLRGTVQVLRSLPAIAAPRDFRLKADSVRRGAGLGRLLAGLRPYPALQLSTALAGLALVVVVGFDVLANNSLAGLSLRQEAAPALIQPMGEIAGEESLAPATPEALSAAEQQDELPLEAQEEFAESDLGPAEADLETMQTEAIEAPSEGGVAEQEQTVEQESTEPAGEEPLESEPEAEQPVAERAAEPGTDAGQQPEPEALAAPDQDQPPEDELRAGPEAAFAATPAGIEPASETGLPLAARALLTAAEIGLALATAGLLVVTLRVRRRV